MFFAILFFVIYLWVLCYFSRQTKNAIIKTKEKDERFSKEHIISKAGFSKKAFNYFGAMVYVSLVFLVIIWLYALVGSEDISSVLEIDQGLCTVICGVSWIGFLFTFALLVFYGWVNIGVSGQFLIVTKEDIIGTSCVTNGVRIQHINFRIKLSEVTDILVLNGEKVLGINLSSFVIVTNTNKYEYALLNDGYEIRRIIEKYKC